MDDASLVGRLARALQDLVGNVAEYRKNDVEVCLPIAGLPARMHAALRALEKRDMDLAKRTRQVLTKSSAMFDERGRVEGQRVPADDVAMKGGQKVAALSAAWNLQAICWSAEHPDWREHVIHVDVVAPSHAMGAPSVTNLWNEVTNEHRKALSLHVREVLPRYENPGHHDPESPTPEQQANYGKFRGKKSEIPRNAVRLLRHAIRDERGGATWWALCEHKFFHRFQGSTNIDGWPLVHWNGTTDERAYGNKVPEERTTVQDIPPKVRAELETRGPVDGCGCR
ncbi:hypothetical protein [Polyangium spumosum]|uniref:Uncharacterized protein n=1 Tax=Polyangium spumosum TaxID=889282 RepID=A0A6N7PGY8_9BACT|nr:hypothetical protein [Polyangium spumosum]MRG91323.1 hypothetical protein [Polyangium spumosum]